MPSLTDLKQQLLLPYMQVMAELGNPVFGNTYEPKQNFAANSNPTPFAERMKNAGLTYFEYPDGFNCYALNRKNADKKHKKWQNEDAED